MKTSLLAHLSRPVDLTAGTPWRVILRYSLPIILSYLLQQLYVLADAAICGQVLRVDEVAGVNDTYALTYFFLQFAFGCAAGFSVVTAQAVGSGQAGRVRASLAAQGYLLLLVSAALTAVSVPLLPLLLRLVNVTPADSAVYGAAYSYCLVIFLGIFAQMGYNLICGVLRAYGDAVTPLLFLLLSTLLNVGLDLLFMIPFGWGPAGAAAATVLAQLLSFAGCTAYTLARYPDLRPRRADWRAGLRELGLHLRQGLPLGAQFSILAVGIIVMQAGAVRFDLTDAGTLAADAAAQNGFGAATKLINFFFAVINGLSSGILGFNAQNFGRGDHDRVRRGTVQTLWMMLAACALCLLATWALTAHGTYQYIFLSADKVSALAAARKHLCLARSRALFHRGLPRRHALGGAGRRALGLRSRRGAQRACRARAYLLAAARRGERRRDHGKRLPRRLRRPLPRRPRRMARRLAFSPHSDGEIHFQKASVTKPGRPAQSRSPGFILI